MAAANDSIKSSTWTILAQISIDFGEISLPPFTSGAAASCYVELVYVPGDGQLARAQQVVQLFKTTSKYVEKDL